MDCPVCGSKAEELPKPFADRRDIRCPVCGEYSISGTAEREFRSRDLTRERRQAELERAKKDAGPGQRPAIRDII